MKSTIFLIVTAIFLMASCQNTETQQVKVIETDWYTLQLYDYCVGSNYAQGGIQYNFDSCASTVDLLQLVVPPHKGEYLNLETVSISEESADRIFSYSFVIKDEAYDSIKAVADDIYSYAYLEDEIILKELSDFLDITINRESKMTKFYQVNVADSVVLASKRVPSSGKVVGSTTSTYPDHRFTLRQKEGSLESLMKLVAKVSGRPLTWEDDSLSYNSDFKFTEASDHLWPDLQERMKNEFGLEFVEDSAAIRFLEIQVANRTDE
ncbi:MAG: hypothetical protein AAFQ94_30070 [Bacteroidota bacterium]